MTINQLGKWNTRVSALYALGVWTMIGSYGYYSYTGRLDPKSVKKEEKDPDPNEVVHQTAHNKTTIIYKKDFVPYTTRIYNFINSFSSGPETGDSEK